MDFPDEGHIEPFVGLPRGGNSIRINKGELNDINKQLSRSFNSGGGGYLSTSNPTGGGGITKSRRASVYQPKLNDDDGSGGSSEKKKTDEINETIQVLLTLIPTDFFESESKKPENKDEDTFRPNGLKDGKPHKGQILTKSVEYIQHLQNLIDTNNRKEVELIVKLKKLQQQQSGNDSNSTITVGYTSAERALGEIGVGAAELAEEYFKQVIISNAYTKK
ncbi:uncharacterized protein KQ657_001798 [Scheffersomyces spartinae]|uniref:BHLH domain-containing protein n=1 Tax=Scheffersomyces spartinae TaxID=45513 RepID=A0A9P7V6Q5_9ASCO|nr:uncharacterized protein KQ657_001798 [Scheffersomyces spartinae]KAG7192399.1 hypothetical protein KQ657_001798 [Scheffersomyces spartinae]